MLILISSTASAAWWDDMFKWFNPTGEAAANVIDITSIAVNGSPITGAYETGILNVACVGRGANPKHLGFKVVVSSKAADPVSATGGAGGGPPNPPINDDGTFVAKFQL